MLGGLYGDLSPPSDDDKSTSTTSSVWSSSAKMAPSTLRFAPPQTILKAQFKPKTTPSSKILTTTTTSSCSSPSVDVPPIQAALLGVTSSVIEEYDPAKPNYYEKYMREKRRQATEAERAEQRRQEEAEMEKREREEREKERERLNAISGEEAWRRRVAMSGGVPRSPSPPEVEGAGGGGGGRFLIRKSETSGLGVGAGGQMTAAQRMMAMMGWKEGQGLGKQEQGITTPLMAKKTDRRAGVIVDASNDSNKKVKSVNFNGFASEKHGWTW